MSEVMRFRTGCTLLDLVVGGGEGLGFPAGKVINFVGDKSSGKTFLGCELIAKNKAVHKDRLRHNYDDGENGFTFDTKHLYGINIMDKDTMRSQQIEDMDSNVHKFLKNLKKDELGIYVLDSLDGLSNDEIEQRSVDRFNAHEKGKEFKDGSYGMKTPKFLSQEFFRTKTKQFAEKDTLFVIISQVRQNIDKFSFQKWARSGGKALDFYAHTVLWLATVKKIVKKGKVVGVVVNAKADKSKTARPFRDCTFIIYFDYGIDNIGSNLDYLFDLRGEDGDLKKCAQEIRWTGIPSNLTNVKQFLEDNKLLEKVREGKKGALALDYMIDWISENEAVKKLFDVKFGTPMTREELINKIEQDPKMEKELEQRVIDMWEAEEQAAKTIRKRKYS